MKLAFASLQWVALFVVALLAAVIGWTLVIPTGSSPFFLLLDFVHMAIVVYLLLTVLRAAADDDYRHTLLTSMRQTFFAGGFLWLALVVWAALSTAWAYYPNLSWWAALVLLLEVALGFVIAATVRRGGLLVVGGLLLLAALPHVGLAVGQTIRGDDLGLTWLAEWPFDPADPYGFGPQAFRAYGLSFHPNILAGYLSITLMIGAVLVYEMRQRRGVLVALLGVMALLFVGLLMTASRTAIAITVVILFPALFVAFRPRGRALWLTLAAVGVGFAGLIALSFVTPVVGQVIQRFRELSVSLPGLMNRIFYAFPNTWELFTRHPVRGVGAENVQIMVASMPPDQHGMRLPAHNVYMLVLAEMGVIGGVLYAAGLWLPIRGLLSRHRSEFLLAAGVVVFSLIIIFDFYFWGFRAVRPITFWLLGMLWGVQTQGREPVTDNTIGVRTQPLDPSASQNAASG